MGRLIPAVAAAALLLLAGTACGERAEPTGATVPLYPVTVVDGSDHPVTMAAEPRRIATLTPAAGEILDAFGLRSRLVGPPEGFFDQRGELAVRKLQAARPDLIVAASSQSELERQLATVKAPIYFAPQSSFDEVELGIIQLGLIAGKPVAARRLVHQLEQQREQLTTKVAGERPVSVFFDTGFFITIPDQSLVGDMIRQAGGRNIAGRNPPPGGFELSELARLNPAVYIAASDSGTTLMELRKNKATRALSAVKNGRFYVIDVGLLEPGPRIGEGLAVLARLLHPDAFR